LATAAIRDDLHEQVQASVEAGARLLCGGSVPQGAGFFYPGTVLESIPEAAPAFGQETFGPVASLFRVPNREAAVELANGTEFGLGASAWTRDDEERDFFTREIAAGSVFINAMVASDPRVPFGGIKKSGYGRELSVQGIREFVNVKTVWISS
jgi:succinate-semialdehyde dehydrogenase/glutarate-semialdehyde dehydrogenase